MTRIEAIERARGCLVRAIAFLEAPTALALDRQPGADALTEALALSTRGTPNALVAAQQAAERAAEHLAADDPDHPLVPARRLLLEAADTLRQADAIPPARTEEPPTGLKASMLLPGLHRIERPAVTPKLRVPPSTVTVEASAYEPLPAPADHEALASHAERAREHIRAHIAEAMKTRDEGAEAAAPTPASGARTFVQRWATECLHEAAMLGSQRLPLPGDDWRLSRELEDRLVWTTDAFASLVAGPEGQRALDEVEPFVLDSPAPDPWRWFSATLLLGCLDGGDSLALIERLARAAADEPEAQVAIADALRVVPHPGLEGMLRPWLDDADPVFRTLAAEWLAPQLGLAELSALAEDRPEIAQHVLWPLLAAGQPADEATARLLDHRGARDVALAALARHDRPRALAHLRGLEDDWALGWLASLGGRDDHARCLEQALRHPSPSTLPAAALAGLLPEAFDGLLPLVQHDDEGIAMAAAQALDRVTGARLRAPLEIPPERLLLPELPEPNTGGFVPPAPPLAPAQARDPEGSPDRVQAPPLDPGIWSAWWKEHRPPPGRYRAGRPHDAAAVLAELDGPYLTPRERRLAGLEMAALTGRDAGFEVSGFVVQQEQALARWR